MQSVMYRDGYVLQSVMSGDLDASAVSDVLDLELCVCSQGMGKDEEAALCWCQPSHTLHCR